MLLLTWAAAALVGRTDQPEASKTWSYSVRVSVLDYLCITTAGLNESGFNFLKTSLCWLIKSLRAILQLVWCCNLDPAPPRNTTNQTSYSIQPWRRRTVLLRPSRGWSSGTRRSRLARIQTDMVAAARCAKHDPNLHIEIRATDPKGEPGQNNGAVRHGGQEPAGRATWRHCWRRGEVDAVVHCLKGWWEGCSREGEALIESAGHAHTAVAPQFAIAAILLRANPHDALVRLSPQVPLPDGGGACTRPTRCSASLPEGAVIGTSALRRSRAAARAPRPPALRRRPRQRRHAAAQAASRTRLPRARRRRAAAVAAGGGPGGGVAEAAEAVPEYAALVLAAAGCSAWGSGPASPRRWTGPAAGGGVFYAVGQAAIAVGARAADGGLRRLLGEALLAGNARDWRARASPSVS